MIAEGKIGSHEWAAGWLKGQTVKGGVQAEQVQRSSECKTSRAGREKQTKDRRDRKEMFFFFPEDHQGPCLCKLLKCQSINVNETYLDQLD